MMWLQHPLYLNPRLAPSLKWLWAPTKSYVSGETGKLYSDVSILVTAMIAAIINQLLITQSSRKCFHDPRIKGWIAIWLLFVAEYFPQFWGNCMEVTFPAKCIRSTRTTSLGIEFQSFSDHCTVQWPCWWGSTQTLTMACKLLNPQVIAQWHSHWGGKGGREPPLTAKKLPKIGKNSGKIWKKRKIREEKPKIRKFLSLCPSWQIGLATLLSLLRSLPCFGLVMCLHLKEVKRGKRISL